MKYDKTELDRLINIDKLSYREIGKIYGVSDTAIKKNAKKLGVTIPVRAKFPIGYVNPNKKPNPICLQCGITFTKKHSVKYCSNKCEGLFRSKEGYNKYLKNQKDYCGKEFNAKPFKKFILEEQDSKCSICQMGNIWNNKAIVFILDHIDGRASNNLRTNLRLVCPNCDSQLDTYKSKNKNSDRKSRYILNYKT